MFLRSVFLPVLFLSSYVLYAQTNPFKGKRNIDIPTIDISNETQRQTVVEKGTPRKRNGHPHTIYLPQNNSILAIWTIGHGGAADQLKRSLDGGKTWSDLMKVPQGWHAHSNCPPLYMLQDPEGNELLTTFVNRGPTGFKMYRATSSDLGETWTNFAPVKIAGEDQELMADVMPFTAIVPIEGGKKLLGVTNIRRPYEGKRTNILAQSISEDGGATWSHWRIVQDLGPEFMLCEPELIRSPDGKQLLMLIRENNRDYNSWIMLSDDEGATWSVPFQGPASVTLDRHQAHYAPDGRLVIVGRDVARNSPSKGHFAAWVGTYDDLANGREGEYRIKLLHSFKTTEYPGLEILPDGTFVATNSVGYRPDENYSIVSVRFKLSEIDKMRKSMGK